jgi:hypothetical protein
VRGRVPGKICYKGNLFAFFDNEILSDEASNSLPIAGPPCECMLLTDYEGNWAATDEIITFCFRPTPSSSYTKWSPSSTA